MYKAGCTYGSCYTNTLESFDKTSDVINLLVSEIDTNNMNYHRIVVMRRSQWT